MTVTAEDMQAKYDDPWVGLADLQNQLNEKDEYINELEGEIQNQSQNIHGTFAKLSAIGDEIEDLEGEEPDSQNQNQNPPGVRPNKHPWKRSYPSPRNWQRMS